MTFVRQVHKTEEESYFGVFQCKRKKGTTPCSYHTVPEKMLMIENQRLLLHSYIEKQDDLPGEIVEYGD